KASHFLLSLTALQVLPPQFFAASLKIVSHGANPSYCIGRDQDSLQRGGESPASALVNTGDLESVIDESDEAPIQLTTASWNCLSAYSRLSAASDDDDRNIRRRN